MSVSPVLLILLPLLSLTLATHSYDSYGEKRYSRCYDRQAYTSNNCRGSYRSYRDGYDRYDRYDRNYDDKIRVGRGEFRINGRDAELICEFPVGSHIISNIIWERGDSSRRRSYSRYNYRDSLDYLDNRMQVRRLGDYGSILTIRNFDERDDAGLYQCVATRSYGGNYSYNRSRRGETIYMDIELLPRYSGSGYYSGRDYDGYFSSYDRYNRRPYYAYSKTEGDTLVTDNSLAELDKKKKKN